MMRVMDVRDLIEEAIRLAGSEAKLGEATGYSQHAIWKAKKLGRVTPQMAAAIDRALNRRVPKERLRPDVFDPPVPNGAAA